MSFCDKHSVISSKQFGFRKHVNELALLTQKELIIQGFEEKKVTLVIFIDFFKGFDKISHLTLL